MNIILEMFEKLLVENRNYCQILLKTHISAFPKVRQQFIGEVSTEQVYTFLMLSFLMMSHSNNYYHYYSYNKLIFQRVIEK